MVLMAFCQVSGDDVWDLYILGRGRERARDRTTLSARKPASFWREKLDTVFILLRGFAKVISSAKTSRAKRLSYQQ